jgi:hypothetical protein
VKVEPTSPSGLQYISSDSENTDQNPNAYIISSDDESESEHEDGSAEESENMDNVESDSNAAPGTVANDDSDDDAPPTRGMRSSSDTRGTKRLSKSPAAGERTTKRPEKTVEKTAKLSVETSPMADFEDTVTVDTQAMLLQKARKRAEITREDTKARERRQNDAEVLVVKPRTVRKKQRIAKVTSPVAAEKAESEPAATRWATTSGQRTHRRESDDRLLNKLQGSSKNNVSKNTTKRKK